MIDRNYSVSTQKKPNVLFIFDDQHRKDACSIYGGKNINTPNIDRLAREGMLFNNAISTVPVCTPYRGMLMTGRYPTYSGVLLNFIETNPHQSFIASLFKNSGYHTGYIGKWHLSAGTTKTAGKYKSDPNLINTYLEENPEPEFTPPGENRLGFEHWEAYNFHMDFKKGWYYRDEPKKLYYDGYETDSQFDQAIQFITKCNKSTKPFFLMLAPHPPHPLWRGKKDVPKEFLDKISQDIQLPPNAPQQFPLGPLKGWPPPNETLTLEEIRTYYAMCKNFDYNLGRILKFLDENKLTNNTIVVYTSDHGEQLGSQNRRSKMVPYSESVDIPLIIRWPLNIKKGKVNNSLYTPMDHLPTLAGLSDVKTTELYDGIDLSKEIIGNEKITRERVLMMNYVSGVNYFSTNTLFPEWRAYRSKRNTFVRWLNGKEELYDNLEDPFQMNNLFKKNSNKALLQKCQKNLKNLLSEADDKFLRGTNYAEWYDDERNLISNANGPI